MEKFKPFFMETNTFGLLFFIVQRHVRMKARGCITLKELIPVNQFSHLTNNRFAWIILSLYVILSALDVNDISYRMYKFGKLLYQNGLLKSSVLGQSK